MENKIKVFLADDHAVVREGLKLIFTKEDDIEVCGEAENGIEAYHKIIECEPDVVLLDISMPDQNGLDLAIDILRHSPKIRIIILSMYSDDAYVSKAIQSGVSGYLLKQSDTPTLIEAVRSVHKGTPFFSRSISSAVLKATQQIIRGESNMKPDIDKLTSREKQVLYLVALGSGSKEISKKLYISVNTVARHRQNIMNKLDIHDAANLTLFAVKEGLNHLGNSINVDETFHFTIRSKVYVSPEAVGRKIIEIDGRDAFMEHLGYSAYEIVNIFQIGTKYDSVSNHPYLKILGQQEQDDIKKGEQALCQLYDQVSKMSIEYSTSTKNRTFIHKNGMKIPSVTKDIFSWEDMIAVQRIRFRDSIDE